MRITSYKNIAFGTISSQDFVPVKEECLKNNKARSTTYWFRQDLDWPLFTDYLIDEMPTGTKIYNFACSDGSEIYSLKMLMDEKMRFNSEKKFEYFAFDINDEALEKAKNQELTIESTDKIKINNRLAYGFDRYFKKTQGKKDAYRFADKKLAEGINFEYGDITKWAKQKQDKPCVVMFRNAWDYLKPEYQQELIDNLSKNMPQGSLLVIGDYDVSHYKVMQKILSSDFQSVEDTVRSCFDSRFVYRKS